MKSSFNSAVGQSAFYVTNNNAMFDYLTNVYDTNNDNFFKTKVNNEGNYFIKYEMEQFSPIVNDNCCILRFVIFRKWNQLIALLEQFTLFNK